MTVDEIRNLAQTIIAGGDSGAKLGAYLLEKDDSTPGDRDINRVAGPPIGVSDDVWPRYAGRKMAHAITLDLNSTPELRKDFPEDARAVALFVSNLVDNEAFEPDTPESAILVLSQSDIERGVSDWEPDADDDGYEVQPCTFNCHEVFLPVEVFREDIYERDEDDPVTRLFQALFQHSLAGGKPIWLQSPEHEGSFILQFDESLVEMNLGDAGIMYVFKDTAFWQCH